MQMDRSTLFMIPVSGKFADFKMIFPVTDIVTNML